MRSPGPKDKHLLHPPPSSPRTPLFASFALSPVSKHARVCLRRVPAHGVAGYGPATLVVAAQQQGQLKRRAAAVAAAAAAAVAAAVVAVAVGGVPWQRPSSPRTVP